MITLLKVLGCVGFVVLLYFIGQLSLEIPDPKNLKIPHDDVGITDEHEE